MANNVHEERLEALKNSPLTLSSRQLLAFSLNHNGLDQTKFSKIILGQSENYIGNRDVAPSLLEASQSAGFDKLNAKKISAMCLTEPFSTQEYWQEPSHTIDNMDSIPTFDMKKTEAAIAAGEAKALAEKKNIPWNKILSGRDINSIQREGSFSISRQRLLNVVLEAAGISRDRFAREELGLKYMYPASDAGNSNLKKHIPEEVAEKIAHFFKEAPYNTTEFWTAPTPATIEAYVKPSNAPYHFELKYSGVPKLKYEALPEWAKNAKRVLPDDGPSEAEIDEITGKPIPRIQKNSKEYQETVTSTYPEFNVKPPHFNSR